MKILITGANGMLAKAVKNTFNEHELICTDIEELDITNLDNVKEYVNNYKPNYIINCAAYTAVDRAEEEVEIAERINVLGVKNLAIAANNNKATIVHISTDYVFDGEKKLDLTYCEEDKTNPQSIYGKTKRDSEIELEKNCTKYYIFRTSWLFGDGNNFVRTMINIGKEKKEVNVVNDQHGSPTYTVDLANIIKESIEKQIPYGIYHATNQDFTTWNKFTKEIFKLTDINCKVNEISSEELIRKAQRPKNSMLSKNKLLGYGINIPSYRDALQRFLREELNR